jgi:ABC-type proline/glycine betaine transport system ATPase subunit
MIHYTKSNRIQKVSLIQERFNLGYVLFPHTTVCRNLILFLSKLS